MARVHLSTRVNATTMARLDEGARRAGLTRSALAERLLEEGMRMHDHPGVVFVDSVSGRTAHVAGTGMHVWEVAPTLLDNGGSVPVAAEYHGLSHFLLRGVASYYAAHKDEIDAEMDANERAYDEFVEQARRRDAAFR